MSRKEVLHINEDKLQQLFVGSAIPAFREYRRLHVAAQLAARNVPNGVWVECGVFNGGGAASIALADPSREVWLYDTFCGIPAPTERDGAEAYGITGLLRGSEDVAVRKVQDAGVARERIVVRKGLFADTFQQELPECVALLHSDGDWYDSVLDTLRTFYDRVPEGGVIVLDDFGYWRGARLAFYDFCRERNLYPLLERLGISQALWVKGKEDNRHHDPIGLWEHV